MVQQSTFRASRRQFLVGTVAVTTLIAGCSGNDTANGDGSPENTFSDTWEIQPGDFQRHQFSIDSTSSIQYDVAVSEGPALDFIVLTDAGFENYSSQPEFQIIPEASTFATQDASVETELSSGSYVLVADYTEKVDATPPDDATTATVEVSLDLPS